MNHWKGSGVIFIYKTHCIVPCFDSHLEDILVTGNTANGDTGFYNSQSKLSFYKVSWRTVGSPLLVFKGECCSAVAFGVPDSGNLLSDCWLNICPLRSQPPFKFKRTISFLPQVLVGKNQSLFVLMGGCVRRSNSYTFVSGSVCAACSSLSHHIKAKLRSDTAWYDSTVYRNVVTHWKLVLLSFWWLFHKSIHANKRVYCTSMESWSITQRLVHTAKSKIHFWNKTKQNVKSEQNFGLYQRLSNKKALLLVVIKNPYWSTPLVIPL